MKMFIDNEYLIQEALKSMHRSSDSYSSPLLIRPPLLQWKNRLIRGVDFIEGDNYVVFYYH